MLPSKEAVKLRGGRGAWSHRNRSGRRDWRVLTSHPTEGASVLAVTKTPALSLLASTGSCPSKELVRVKSAEEVLWEELVAMSKNPSSQRAWGQSRGVCSPPALRALPVFLPLRELDQELRPSAPERSD